MRIVAVLGLLLLAARLAVAQPASADAACAQPNKACAFALARAAALEINDDPRSRASALRGVADAAGEPGSPIAERRERDAIAALAAAGRGAEALAAVDALEVRQRPAVLIAIGRAHEEAGRHADADAALSRLGFAESTPGHQAFLLAAIGRAEPALALAQSIGDPGQKQLALSAIARIHGEAGRRDAGLAAIRAMPDGQRRSATLSLAAVLQDPALFEEAMSYAPTSRSLLDILVRMLAARGRFDEAITRARRIDDPDVRARLLTDILRAHDHPGLAEEALRNVRAIPDESHRADAIARLARAAADPAFAAEALQAVSAHPDSPDHTFALADIAAALTAAGRLNEALDMAAGIAISPENLGPLGRNRALTAIAVTLAGQRRAAEALDITRRVTDPSDRCNAFVAVAIALPE
jgi:hypothetical protein